jgi:hypothetical protein
MTAASCLADELAWIGNHSARQRQTAVKAAKQQSSSNDRTSCTL